MLVDYKVIVLGERTRVAIFDHVVPDHMVVVTVNKRVLVKQPYKEMLTFSSLA